MTRNKWQEIIGLHWIYLCRLDYAMTGNKQQEAIGLRSIYFCRPVKNFMLTSVYLKDKEELYVFMSLLKGQGRTFCLHELHLKGKEELYVC